jgi:hypothetical protein
VLEAAGTTHENVDREHRRRLPELWKEATMFALPVTFVQPKTGKVRPRAGADLNLAATARWVSISQQL